MSVACSLCGGTEFEKKDIVTITETRMRFKLQMELEYEQTEYRYCCANPSCGVEYVGLYGP